MPNTTAERTPLTIALGREGGACFEGGPPVLAGESKEEIFGASRAAGRSGDLSLFESGDWLLGIARAVPAGDLAAFTRRIYGEIFAAARGRHLARIWNYVPAINGPAPSGEENYREFCRGRSEAFEHWRGADFKAAMPAASAVGATAAELTVLFAAHRTAPRHFENPLQVPAYDYPSDYGLRAPSFARASTVVSPGRRVVFISGTAAIRGHRSVAPHCTGEQLDCTLENLREISLATGLGPDLAPGEGGVRHFKIYLRHTADLPEVTAVLDRRLIREGDRVTYLHAAICRAELNVEIEATVCGGQ